MKNKFKLKQALSVLLSLSIITSFGITSLATSEDFAPDDSCLTLDDYVQHTITLPTTSSQSRSNTKSLREKNIENILSAKDYVESLNLEEQGLGYIEEQCLDELDSFLADAEISDDKILAEYTVLTPKSTNAAYTFFGKRTVGGVSVNFYSNLTSVANWDMSKVELSAASWFNSGTSLVMSFCPTWKLSITVASLQSLPQFINYEIKPSDRVEAYWRVSQVYRNIYVQDNLNLWNRGEGAYVLVYKSDIATVTPFNVVFKDTSTPPFTEEVDFTPQSFKAFGYDDPNHVMDFAAPRYFDSTNRAPVIENALDDVDIIGTIAFE